MAQKQLLLMIATVFLIGLAVVAGLEAAQRHIGPAEGDLEAGAGVTRSIERAS